MNVGVCKVRLHVPDALSLKEKRQVLKSIISRLKNKFDISVAEVDNNDKWQLATIGFAYVSNDKRFTNEVLCKAMDFIVNSRTDAEVIDHEIEIIDF